MRGYEVYTNGMVGRAGGWRGYGRPKVQNSHFESKYLVIPLQSI